jgi:hypothetical protein
VPLLLLKQARLGPCDFDIRNVLSATLIWDLPSMKGSSRVLSTLTGGWELGTIVSAYSGAPFTATDPARNGPYGDSLRVLRSDAAATTYKRGSATDPNMRNISPDEVFEVLQTIMGARRHPAGSLAE